MNELAQIWLQRLQELDIAFQPIVNIHTGNLYGVEALLRGVQNIGFSTVFELFDEAYKEDVLYSFDLALREKVIQKFMMIDEYMHIKLFINLDNRLLEMSDYCQGNTVRLLKKYGLQKEMICFELSERHEIRHGAALEDMLANYKGEGFNIAVDDFGSGYAGYKLLHQSAPDIIKIDRFFMGSICKDKKKRILVKGIVAIAVQLGITVIAEGIENETELLTCRELGCHLVQGYAIQKPTTDVSAICLKYKVVKANRKRGHRHFSYKSRIKDLLFRHEPRVIDQRMADVIDRFKHKHHDEIIPVVDKQGFPLGILDEPRIKKVIVSPFGHALMRNESVKEPGLKKFIQRCPIADINTDIDQLIECFSEDDDITGVIISKNMKYMGYLSARAILKIIGDYNLMHAREQNPLTKLPGNHKIDEYITNLLISKKEGIVVYFDFNNFKAYNDRYGFRKGDRVIQLFADLLRKKLPPECFKGHIGGDDFFVGMISSKERADNDIDAILGLCRKFSDEVETFYDPEDRQRGYIVAKDRNGVEQQFGFLSVSATVIQISSASKQRNADQLHAHFTEQKKVSKHSVDSVSLSCLL